MLSFMAIVNKKLKPFRSDPEKKKTVLHSEFLTKVKDLIIRAFPIQRHLKISTGAADVVFS